jgi:hypothetical protein
MARDSMDVTSFVGKLLKEDDSDILRDGIKALAQMIMDVEVSSKIGAVPYERTEHRAALSQWLPHPRVGHSSRHRRAQDPQDHSRHRALRDRFQTCDARSCWPVGSVVSLLSPASPRTPQAAASDIASTAKATVSSTLPSIASRSRQIRCHRPARVFIERKQQEGKNKREALRCLKRHLVRVVFNTLQDQAASRPMPPTPLTAEVQSIAA